MNDIRFAFRKLRQSPAFTFIAVLTLALGIGLNTTIFSLVNDLFLRGLPFKEPSRVVHLFGGDKSRGLEDIGVSAPRYMHYREGQTLFESIAGENFFAFTLTGLGDAVQVFGGRLTSNYFELLGVRPILGRNFLPQEEEGADVAVVTKAFWQKRLGGDANVIGRSITLDGVAHTIVGVLPNMPVTWFGANPIAEVWTTKPFQLPGFSYDRMMRGTSFLRVIGRMKPGMTLAQVKAALPSLDQSYRTQYPNKIDSSLTTTVRTLPQDVTQNFRAGFITLFAAVTFVLLIACSNVANLLLVRFSGRRREIALRMAIGASRSSVIRLFVFESVLVSAIAGVIGAFVAWRLVPLIPRMASNFLPLEANTTTGVSLPVLLFTVGLSLLTGLLMGIYPALQGSHADLVEALKEGGRGTAGSVRQQRFRKILVGAQVALSVTLLAGAALLITSFIRLNQQNIGFRTQNLWTGAITLPTSQYADSPSRQRFVEQTLDALRDTPGVESATISGDIPLNGGNRTLYARGDREVPPIEKRASSPSHDISPNYLKTWGIPLLAGREFNEHDVGESQKVCLVSQAGAKKVWPGENPIGKTLLVTSLGVPCEIVGIVGDVRSVRVNEAPGMEFYLPWSQENFPFVNVTIRTNLKLDAATKVVQSAINKVNPNLAIAVPQMMEAVVAQALGQARLMTWLLGIFAGVALLLASIGIYGAVAYTVEQRTGEIGVRMALGAQTRDVLRLVINQGMKPVVIGLAIGIVAAFALGRLISSQLFEVSAHNPALLGGATILLAAIALLACLLPARRATLVDPVQALRAE
ncbi:MAG TPA: ABC transporter permease [Chthoniobacterales bacterium]|jgi:putative ABC transport system permease protein|nr:ABC transporter permease [Chthoniobacterales bacterium]